MMPLVFFAGNLRVEMQAKVAVLDFVETSTGERAFEIRFLSLHD